MARYKRTDAEARLLAAINAMPHGGSERVSRHVQMIGVRVQHGETGKQHTPVDIGDVAAYLEALSEAFREQLAYHPTCWARLSALESDLEAVRRVLGTTPSSPLTRITGEKREG